MIDNKKYWLIFDSFKCKICKKIKTDYNEMLVHMKILHEIDNEKQAIRNMIGFKGVEPID